MKRRQQKFRRGENHNQKNSSPPQHGRNEETLEFPELPDPRGTPPKYRYADSIEVFQNGNKVMGFYNGPMKIVTENKYCIEFYDSYDRRTTIYNNSGIIFVRYKAQKNDT